MKDDAILIGWRYAITRVILLLEWLPAYRRFYRIQKGSDQMQGPYWRYCRPGQGMWSLSLLHKLGWFHPLMNRWFENAEWTVVSNDDEPGSDNDEPRSDNS